MLISEPIEMPHESDTDIQPNLVFLSKTDVYRRRKLTLRPVNIYLYSLTHLDTEN